MPELLARDDAQQQIQSYYFIEVMNDYLQDVEAGQAYLLNEIRKNTGNIRLRADNVTMNTQQIELLLGGLHSHTDYNELKASDSDPSTPSYLIQELDGSDNPTGNVVLTTDPSQLESDQYGLILQDVLWEEIPGENGGDPTYKEISSFRYARDQIEAIKAIYTASVSDNKTLVDVHEALIDVYSAVSGQDAGNTSALGGVSSTISSSMSNTTISLIGTTQEWDDWNALEDPDPELEPIKYPDQNLYELIDTEITAVTTALTDTIEVTLEEIDKALRTEGYLKDIDSTLSDQLDIKVSNLETLLLNVLSAPGVTLDASTNTYLDDQGVTASFINLDDVKTEVNTASANITGGITDQTTTLGNKIDALFTDPLDTDKRSLYDLYETITKIHSTTLAEYASLFDVKTSIDSLLVTSATGVSIFDLDATVTSEFTNLKNGKTLSDLDTSIGNVQGAIETLQGTETFTIETLEGKVGSLLEVTTDGAKTSIFDLNFNLVDDTSGQFRLLKDDLTKAYVNGEDRLNIPGLGEKINLALLGTIDDGTSGVSGTSVTSVIEKEISSLEDMLIGSTALVGDTSNLYEIEKDIERIRGLVGNDVEDSTKKNLKDLHTSLESIKGSSVNYQKNLNDIYDRLGNLSLEVNNVAVNTDQLEQLIGCDFTRDLYTPEYIAYVDDIYVVNALIYPDQIDASGVSVEDYNKNNYLAYSSSYWQDAHESLGGEIFLYGGNAGRSVSDVSSPGDEHPLTDVVGFSSIFDRMSESKTTLDSIKNTLENLNKATRESSFFDGNGDLTGTKKTIQDYLDSLHININKGLIDGQTDSESRLWLLNDDLNEGLFTNRDSQPGEEPKLDRITNELLRLQGNYPVDWVSTSGSPHDGFTNSESSNLYEIEKDLERIRGIVAGDTLGNTTSNLLEIESRLLDIQGYDNSSNRVETLTDDASLPNIDSVIKVLRNFRGGSLDTELDDVVDNQGQDVTQPYNPEDPLHDPITTLYPTFRDIRDVLNTLKTSIDQIGGVFSENPGKIEALSSNFFELGNQINSLRGEVPELDPSVYGYFYNSVRNLHDFNETYDASNVDRIEDFWNVEGSDFFEHSTSEDTSHATTYPDPDGSYVYEAKTSNLYQVNENIKSLYAALTGDSVTESIIDKDEANDNLLSQLRVISSDATAVDNTNLYDIEYAIGELKGVSDKTLTDVNSTIGDIRGSIVKDGVSEETETTLARVVETLTSYDDFQVTIPNVAYQDYLNSVASGTWTGEEDIPAETILAEGAFESKNLVDLYYKLETLSGDVRATDPVAALSNLELSVGVQSTDTIRAIVGWDYDPDADGFDEAAWITENRNIFDEINTLSNDITGYVPAAEGVPEVTAGTLKGIESAIGGVASDITGGTSLSAVSDSIGGIASAITGTSSTTLSDISDNLTGDGGVKSEVTLVKTAVDTATTAVNSLTVGDKYKYEIINNELTRVIDAPPELEVEFTAFADIYNAIIDQTEEVKKVQLEVGSVIVNTDQLERLIGWDFDGNVEFNIEDGDTLYQNTLFQRLEMQKKDIVDAIQQVTVYIGDVAVNTDQLERLIGWDFADKTPVASYADFLANQLVNTEDNPVNRQAFLDENPSFHWDDLYIDASGAESVVKEDPDDTSEVNNTLFHKIDLIASDLALWANVADLFKAPVGGELGGAAYINLEELRTSVDTTTGEITRLIDTFTKDNPDNDLFDHLISLTSSIKGDQGLVDAITTPGTGLSAIIESNSGAISGVGGLSEKIGLLDTSISDGTTGLNSKVVSLDTSISGVDGLTAKIVSLESANTGLTTELGELETAITTVDTGLSARLFGLDTSISASDGLSDKLSELSGFITGDTGLNKKIEGLTSNLDSDSEFVLGIGQLETEISNVSTEISTFSGYLAPNATLQSSFNIIATSLDDNISTSLSTIAGLPTATEASNSIKGVTGEGNDAADANNHPGINLHQLLIGLTESGASSGSNLHELTEAVSAQELDFDDLMINPVWSTWNDGDKVDPEPPGGVNDKNNLFHIVNKLSDLTQPGAPVEGTTYEPKTLYNVADSVDGLEVDIGLVRKGLINEANMEIYETQWLDQDSDYVDGSLTIAAPRGETTDEFTTATGRYVYKLDEVAQAVTALKEFQRPTNDFENGSVGGVATSGQTPIPVETTDDPLIDAVPLATEGSEEDFSCSRGVTVTAHTENSGILFVGKDNEITAGTNQLKDGIPLTAGDSLFLPVRNPSSIYVIADYEAGSSPNFLYWLAV